ncbi:hypothetical protein HDU93_002106 [Gonapodya sp. JEL0774]|nr:hypothetical protein HDU93_002106 [Gonapodya sp. JEL0774]
MSDELSDYEILRKKRIEENQALLKSLNIPSIRLPKEEPISERKKSAHKRKREESNDDSEVSEPIVRRVSSRLRSLPPDSDAAQELQKQREEEEARERKKGERVNGPVHVDNDIKDPSDMFSSVFAKFTTPLLASLVGNSDPSKLTVCVPDAVRFSKERVYSLAAYPRVCGSSVGAFFGDKQGNIGFVGIDMEKAREVKEREGTDFYEDGGFSLRF